MLSRINHSCNALATEDLRYGIRLYCKQNVKNTNHSCNVLATEDLRYGIRLDCKQNVQNANSGRYETRSVISAISSAESIIHVAVWSVT